MATQVQHDWLLLMQEETLYGTGVTVPTDKFCDTLEPTFEPEEIEISDTHHGTLFDHANDTFVGRLGYAITTKGMLTKDHTILLEAILLDKTSPHTPPDEDPGTSYTLTYAYQPTSAALTVGMVATGARVKTWSITRNGAYWQYEINWICKTFDPNATISTYTATGVTDFTYPEFKPFLWKHSIASIRDTVAVSNVIDYSISGENTHIEDDVSFQNAETRILDKVCGQSGVVTGKVVYDTVLDKKVYDVLFDGVCDEGIALKDGVEAGDATWNFVFQGIYSGYNLPSEKKCLYQSDYTMNLKTTNAKAAITVTVS